MSKRDCCKNPDNLEPVEETTSENAITVKRECQECGCAHYTQIARPIRVSMTGDDA